MSGAWQERLLPETPLSDTVGGVTFDSSRGGSRDHGPTNNNLLGIGNYAGIPHSLSNNKKGSSEVKKRNCSQNSCGDIFWKLYSSGRADRRKKYHEDKRRIFLKNGEVNSKSIHIQEKKERYFSDMFTTLVDARWRWTLFIFSLSYLFSWIGFAIVWWVILLSHGDVAHFGLDDGWEPCVMGVRGVTSVFLFSIETQHTIGYGFHRMTDNCPEAIVVLCTQSITGVLIEAFMVGVVFAKLSRPKKRSKTLIFSNNAVICLRDSVLHLMWRVGDMRRSKILEAHVRAQVITKKTTKEGEVIPIHQEEIKVGAFSEDEDRILLFQPTIIVHKIDEDSPFYSMSSSEFLNAKIEIIVIMEGVVESTGMTTQARTSYLPHEVLWGHRFSNMSTFKSEQGLHQFDFEFFHSTYPVETPLCSAESLDHIRDLKSKGINGRDIMASISLNAGVSRSRSLSEDGTSPPHSCIDLQVIEDQGQDPEDLEDGKNSLVDPQEIGFRNNSDESGGNPLEIELDSEMEEEEGEESPQGQEDIDDNGKDALTEEAIEREKNHKGRKRKKGYNFCPTSESNV